MKNLIEEVKLATVGTFREGRNFVYFLEELCNFYHIPIKKRYCSDCHELTINDQYKLIILPKVAIENE